MIPKGVRGRATAMGLALACSLASAPSAAQEVVSAAELQQITCHVLTVPNVRAAVEAGTPPLLVVSGREMGYLRMPAAPCPARSRLPRGVTEFRIIAAHTAPQLYGERGRNGAVLVDLPPAAPR
jgi:hypothetical protein